MLGSGLSDQVWFVSAVKRGKSCRMCAGVWSFWPSVVSWQGVVYVGYKEGGQSCRTCARVWSL